MMDRSANRNRSMGGRPPQDWCGRVVLYSPTHPSRAACSSASVAYWPSAAPEELGPHRLVQPLHLPCRGRRVRLGQQVLDPVIGADPVEQDVGPGQGPNLAVNTLPLSVRICSGIPWRRSASAGARQEAGRAVAGIHPRAHDEPGMVIDARHDLDFLPRRPGGRGPSRPSATAASPGPAPTAGSPLAAACASSGPPGHAGSAPGTPPTAPAAAPPPPSPVPTRSAMAPTRDDPAACSRSAPRPARASDAGTTPAATTGPPAPPAHPAHRPRASHSCTVCRAT